MQDDYIEIHVDETGDRGFHPRSSQYFCFAACAFRHSKARRVIAAMENLNGALGRPADVPLHAVKHLKTHEKMMEAVEHLAGLPVRISYVILPKSITPPEARSKGPDYIYNVLAGVLLRRMNQFAHGVGIPAQPVFAAVKGMPRTLLDSHISSLKHAGTDLPIVKIANRRPLRYRPNRVAVERHRWPSASQGNHPVHIPPASHGVGLSPRTRSGDLATPTC